MDVLTADDRGYRLATGPRHVPDHGVGGAVARAGGASVGPADPAPGMRGGARPASGLRDVWRAAGADLGAGSPDLHTAARPKSRAHGWENRAHDHHRPPTAGALGHPADRGLVPPRQLPRRGPAVGGPAGRPRRLLLRRRPARAHRRARPEDARARRTRDGRRPAAGAGRRPGPVHGVRPVARARAHPAGVGAGLPHRVRRGEPDDAVQGQVAPSSGRTACRWACSPTRS